MYNLKLDYGGVWMSNQSESTVNLSSLVQEMDSIGNSDENYVEKLKFIKEALYFPCTQQEQKLLRIHIAKTYGIFVLELLFSFILAIVEFNKPSIFLPIAFELAKLGKLSFIVYFLIVLGIFFLSSFADKRDSIFLKVISVLLTVILISQAITVVILALVSCFGINIAIGWTLLSLLMTSLIFIGSAVYGLFTKHNITGWGGPLNGALLASILFGWVSYFFHLSGHLLFLVGLSSIIDIVIFTCFIMYDNQMIKVRFLDKYRDDIPDTKNSWWILAMDSSIELYLDFMNLFLDFLTLFSSDEDD